MPGLPVAVGWSPTKKGAASALADLRLPSGSVTITGRYNVSDAPSDSNFEANQVTTVSAAALGQRLEDDGLPAARTPATSRWARRCPASR